MQDITRQIEQLKLLAIGFIVFAAILIVILIIMFVKFGFYKRAMMGHSGKRAKNRHARVKAEKDEEFDEEDEPEMEIPEKKPERIKRAVDIDEGADETAVLDEDEDDASETFTIVKNVVKTHTTEEI